MKRKILLLLIFLVIGIGILLAFDTRMIIRSYVLECEQITSPVRLAVVTDLHGCDYGQAGEKLTNAVIDADPDLVLLVGDIFDDVLPWNESEAVVRKLASLYSCFYVTGNHEYWSEQVDEICQIIVDCGAVVLDMECQTIDVSGQRLNICGIPDPYAMVYSDAPDTSVQLKRAAEQAEQGTYTILLAHRPELIDQYAVAGCFDLVLSGHAHGGQVRIPGVLNGLYAPNQGIFPKYAGGMYCVENTTMIVSRGLAKESTLFPRIFNNPELLIVELQ